MTRSDPPAPASGQRRHHGRRRYVAAGTGVLLGGALGYVGLVDPHHTDALYPLCPFKWLTGWNCPFCGGLRMTHDLLHGDLMAGINDNVFLLVGIPMLAGWVLIRRGQGRSILPLPALILVVVAAIAWTVVRNLPGFPLIPTILRG